MAYLQTGDALVIVDLQNDFLPGGPLGVPGGDEIIPVLNKYIAQFHSRRLPIYATRDWHPPNHCSFSKQGGVWPSHCVAGTDGAETPKSLALPPETKIVRKGTIPQEEAYSGFEGTQLDEQLKEGGVKRVFVGGLATDYCVFYTVKDALHLGYTVYLLTDAIRGVNVQPTDVEEAQQTMLQQGAQPIQISDVGAS